MSTGLVINNVIDSESRPPDNAEYDDLVDPVSGQTYGIAARSAESDVEAAFTAAGRASTTWSKTTPRERQRLMLRLADLIDERVEDLLRAEVRCTGKPVAITRTLEIERVADQFRFFAGACRTMDAPAAGDYVPGTTSFVRREPLGVVAQVTPWNYPLMMAAWKLAPALAGGNSIVLKPAESTPESTVMLAELCAELFPAGVVNVVTGGRETGRMMMSHARPELMAITGSTRAGSEVMSAAAQSVRNVHLELGGKAPAIVFADAELDGAARGIAEAAFFNGGQDCTAITRVLVAESIAEAFLEKLRLEAVAIVTDGPENVDAFYGPLNSQEQLERVESFIQGLPNHASVLCGGRRVERAGFFFPATIIVGVHQEDAVVQREIFGPVITVQTFQDEDEAIEKANGVDYALSSSVWTESAGRAMRLSGALDFGTVWVNCHMILPAEMPHGGFKQSGIGKDLSTYSLADYTRIKHVMVRH